VTNRWSMTSGVEPLLSVSVGLRGRVGLLTQYELAVGVNRAGDVTPSTAAGYQSLTLGLGTADVRVSTGWGGVSTQGLTALQLVGALGCYCAYVTSPAYVGCLSLDRGGVGNFGLGFGV
jgi:hypothetical protein